MIQLTRLNNHSLIVNSDLIKFLEKSPDTVLTLVTGEKIVVRETSEDKVVTVTARPEGIVVSLRESSNWELSTARATTS